MKLGRAVGGILAGALLACAPGCGLFQTGFVTQNASPWGADHRVRQCGRMDQSSYRELLRARQVSAQTGGLVQNANPWFFSSRVDQVATLVQSETHRDIQPRASAREGIAPEEVSEELDEETPIPVTR